MHLRCQKDAEAIATFICLDLYPALPPYRKCDHHPAASEDPQSR